MLHDYIMELYALYFVYGILYMVFCIWLFVFCMVCILYFVNGMLYLYFVGHWMYLYFGRFDAQIYNPVINKL